MGNEIIFEATVRKQPGLSQDIGKINSAKLTGLIGKKVMVKIKELEV